MNKESYDALLRKAKRITGMQLNEGPYSEAELNNVIKDYLAVKKVK